MPHPDISLPGLTSDQARLVRLAWLDRLWSLLLIIFLAAVSVSYFSLKNCAYLATDFRGYYASAQIALEHGLSAIYDQPIQDTYQSGLPYRCPDGSAAAPLLRVSVPYLPVFGLIFLPLAGLEFTVSYLVWSVINSVIFYAYLYFFSKSLAGKADQLRLLQWLVCLPFLANLSLGQVNVLWVICLGEFSRAVLGGKPARGGLWLAGLMIKPHALLLLLFGLLAARQWRALAGFLNGCVIVLCASWLLVGGTGFRSILNLVSEFSRPDFLSAPAMVNWRALGLNLQGTLPGGLAWGAALIGMVLTACFVFFLWRSSYESARRDPDGVLFLMLATVAGTCAVAWHSNLYMLMAMIPFWLVLDIKGLVPVALRWVWIAGPLAIFGLAWLLDPGSARSLLGTALFGLNLFVTAWAGKQSLRRSVGPALDQEI